MKVVVYTAIFGGYDHVRAPLNQNPDAQYVLFTDAPASAPGVDVRVMKPKYNRRKSAREVKVMAHRYLPDADYTVDAYALGGGQASVDPLTITTAGFTLYRADPFGALADGDFGFRVDLRV